MREYINTTHYLIICNVKRKLRRKLYSVSALASEKTGLWAAGVEKLIVSGAIQSITKPSIGLSIGQNVFYILNRANKYKDYIVHARVCAYFSNHSYECQACNVLSKHTLVCDRISRSMNEPMGQGLQAPAIHWCTAYFNYMRYVLVDT